MFHLYVFDLDGTLVDSRRDIADAANALLEACGARPLSEATIGRMVGEGAAVLVARAFEAAGMVQPPDALARFLTLYEQRQLVHTRPYAEMADVLEKLAARASLAVLTNKPLGAARSILSGVGLAPFFDPSAVVGGDGPFPPKPDPAGLRHLISRAAADAATTLLVGDSIVDWQTARSARATVCVAQYGFGFATFNAAPPASESLVIGAPADLLSL